MTVIHIKCNAPLESSGEGDYGICTKCGERVDHLVMVNGKVYYSREVLIHD